MSFSTSFVVLLVSFVVIAQCDSENLPLISNGEATVRGEAPSVVSIRRPTIVGQLPNTYCTGTIVNANHVITATSCVHDTTNHLINPFWFRIIAGDLNILNPAYQRFTTRPSHIYTHPDYTAEPRRNNIAVMRTIDSFPFPHNTIDIAVRNVRPLAVGQVCRFVGWGAATTTGGINANQQRVNAPIIGCGGTPVVENMFCAGSLTAVTPPTGVCTGNMGGPLFCDVNGWWEFTGILSDGIACGAANSPGVYMQVRSFEAWINQQFTRTDATNPGLLVQRPAN